MAALRWSILKRSHINSLPSVDTIVITPSSSVEVGTVLICAATASDYEDGILIPTYEWTTNGVLLSSLDTYVVNGSEANLGDVITCTATVIDSDNNSGENNVGVVVQNTPPVVSNVSISPSIAVTNDAVLTCTPPLMTLMKRWREHLCGIETAVKWRLVIRWTWVILMSSQPML